MLWKGPDERTEYPTLGLIVDSWVRRHCVIPDGFKAGRPFVFTTQQYNFQAQHYRLLEAAQPAWLWAEEDFDEDEEREIAFVHRRSQLVRAQKWGKNPFIAAVICVEGVGPALFSGWAGRDDGWACSEHGCGCGWEWPYEPGDPMAMTWPTPLIQITATSEDQTDNTWDALRPMIDNGPLHDIIPKTGEEFIRLHNEGRIDIVTSNARSRLGQRVTFVPQDETSLWTPTSGMVKVAHTQRRGLAAMGGRAIETTNAWDPDENSIAQQTYVSPAPDIHKDYRKPPAHLSYANKAERRQIHKFNYEGCPWVTLSGIEGEAVELMAVDPTQPERFFGNRVVRGPNTWLPENDWDELAGIKRPEAMSEITAGFVGRAYQGAALIACSVEDGVLWVEQAWETAGDQIVSRSEVNAAVESLFDRFLVRRFYVNPQEWASEYDAWYLAYGEEVVITRPPQQTAKTAYAVDRFRTAIGAKELRHDGNEVLRRHILGAVTKSIAAGTLITTRTEQPNDQITAARAAVLAWEARADVLAEVQEQALVPHVW